MLGRQLMHASAVDAPTVVEYVPPGQSTHDADPGLAVYLPAPHVAHGPPSGPEYPAMHTQSLAASLPAGASDPDGQGVHGL